MGAETDLPGKRRFSGQAVAGVARNTITRLVMVFFLGCILVFPSLSIFGAFGPSESIADDQLEVVVLATGLPPVFAAEPRDPTPATYGVRVNFTGIVRDPDGDALNVTWEWGDGTTNYTSTGPAGSNTIIRNGHVYTPPIQQGMGDYNESLILRITLDDGNGNLVNCTTLVLVMMPPNGYPARPSLQLNGTALDKIDPSATVYVVANTSDPEGESLVWTYVFTNGTGVIYRVAVVNTPATEPNENVWANISHSFGTVGQHQIDVYVSDALLEEYQVYPHNRSQTIFQDVAVNQMPNVGASINVDPQSPVVNATIGYKLVTYFIEASDPDGDVLTVTWDFDDGLPEVVNTSAGGKGTYAFYQVRNYTEAGIFNVTLVVTDGREGHEVYRNRLVNVSSTNRPPTMVVFQAINLSLGSYGQPNETIEFLLVISDPEMDPVEVVIDWGDGSEVITFMMPEYVGGNTTIILSHNYTRRGNFTITVNYTDNKIGVFMHNKSYSLQIELREVFEIIIEGWSWWDYTSLGLLGIIPVVIGIWMVRVARQRRMLEQEGLTIDEWRLLRDEKVAEAIEKESNK